MRTQFEWRGEGELGMLGTVGAEYEIQVSAKNLVPMAVGAGGGHPVGARLDVVERVRNARAGCAPAVAGLVRRAGPMDSAQFITVINDQDCFSISPPGLALKPAAPPDRYLALALS